MKTQRKIAWAKPNFWGKEKEFVLKALASTWISGGPYIELLEKNIADFCSIPYALATSNGTTALHMAYLGLNIGPGDEVIVPGFCFMAVANIAIHVGAEPVFAEVDPKSWCVTPERIEKLISQKTKAIVPVHTYGNVCLMDGIMELAKSHGIAVIEDAAESFASRYQGRLAGTIADIGTFSFHATKTITTGEGGMVITRDKDLFEKMALYRSHGMTRKGIYYWHEVPGHNFRLTNLQAALGCAQLEHLEEIINARRRVYQAYCTRLHDLDGIELQHFPDEVEPVVWAVALWLDPKAYPQGRDTVIHQFQEYGIEIRPGFYAASLMKDMYDCPRMPICESISQWVISLPTYPTLEVEHIDTIVNVLEKIRR